MKRLVLALALVSVLVLATTAFADRGRGTYGAYRGRSSYQSYYRPSYSYGRIASRSLSRAYGYSGYSRVRAHQRYGSYGRSFSSLKPRLHYNYVVPRYHHYSYGAGYRSLNYLPYCY